MAKRGKSPQSEPGEAAPVVASARATTGAEIRQAFLDFFAQRDHRVVPSAPLVPAGDPTLLFTNAGMVPFKDVFLGLEQPPYARAASVQRCMRVSGKHNDLEVVGPSARHHTFFEMLGNFSFGDYFKPEAIRYAYDCLTGAFGLPVDRLFFTVHQDDDEAYQAWVNGIGVPAERVVRLGDKTNFWQMADVGPCGPTTEIHYDRSPEKGALPAEALAEQLDDNPDDRFVELWNLVFMQYSQAADGSRTPLPKPGVDTGMGLERLVSIVQGVDGNYDTDLFLPIFDRIQSIAGHTDKQRAEASVAYRVIADHVRAATFLIADGVPPGNDGRNYVTRMVIRRAARFANKYRIGGGQTVLAGVAGAVIENYGLAYPELVAARDAVLQTIDQEEDRFRRTLDIGVAHLASLLFEMSENGQQALSGEQAFELYATYGLPLEITRDVARERGLDVDEAGFHHAMEDHRVASGAGQAMGDMGSEATAFYQGLLERLKAEGALSESGVDYDPYATMDVDESILVLMRDGQRVPHAKAGETVEVVLPRTCFYVESGGQVSDTGSIVAVGEDETPEWEIRVTDVRRPVPGLIVHVGEVVRGSPTEGERAFAAVDDERRWDIMRNHTATHLLHSELRYVLGGHVHQAGSLVAPDRLRFDFQHAAMLTQDQLTAVEQSVNDAILANYPVLIDHKSRDQAVSEGAMALFDEKYGDVVRTIRVGEPEPFSYELCGGTHVPETADIGPFVVLSESSVAAGVRRIEAATGRAALETIRSRLRTLDATAAYLRVPPENVDRQVLTLLEQIEESQKEIGRLKRETIRRSFDDLLQQMTKVNGVPLLAATVKDADVEMLREMTDWFRTHVPSGVAVLGTVHRGKPSLVAAVTDDLVPRGLDAVRIVKAVAKIVGGGGGGKPTLAQAGGRDSGKLAEAIAAAPGVIKRALAS